MTRFGRWLPVLSAAVAVGSVFVWLNGDRQFRHDAFEAGSLNNYGERGCSLAYRYLEERRKSGGARVGELNRTLDQQPLEANAVVLRIDPQHIPGVYEDPEEMLAKSSKSGPGTKPATTVKAKPSTTTSTSTTPSATPATTPATTPTTTTHAKKEKPKTLLTAGEETWLRGGGRLVLALRGDYQTILLTSHTLAPSADKVFPLWPGFDKLNTEKFRTLGGPALDAAVTVFAASGYRLVARIPVGKGDAIVFGTPALFQNDSFGNDAHAALLEALAPPERPVYFDEFVHGLQDAPGILELLNGWSLGMAACLAAIAGLAAWWRMATPVGTPVDDHRERRTQAIDFVGSVAPLYDQALTNRQALALYYNQFVRAATLRTGLRGEALTERVRALLGGASEHEFLTARELPARELSAALHRLNEAYGRLERAHRR